MVGTIVFLGVIVGCAGKKGEVKLSSTAKNLLSPSMSREVELNDQVSFVGEYDWSVAKYGPKKLTVLMKDLTPGRLASSAKMMWSDPLSLGPPVVEVALGTPETGRVILDSKVQPTTVSDAIDVVQVLEYKWTKLKGIVLEPRFKPRDRRKANKGLELDVKANLNGDRATLKATVAPKTRPILKFSFAIADDLKLDLQPLIGDDASKTKLDIEKSNIGPRGKAKVTASILDKALTITASLPDNILGAAGSLKPSISVDLAHPKTSLALKLSQSFDL